MSSFEVRWTKPNLTYSWRVKNGLFPSINGSSFYQSFSDSNFFKKIPNAAGGKEKIPPWATALAQRHADARR
jgi:hypothetical protein